MTGRVQRFLNRLSPEVRKAVMFACSIGATPPKIQRLVKADLRDEVERVKERQRKAIK